MTGRTKDGVCTGPGPETWTRPSGRRSFVGSRRPSNCRLYVLQPTGDHDERRGRPSACPSVRGSPGVSVPTSSRQSHRLGVKTHLSDGSGHLKTPVSKIRYLLLKRTHPLPLSRHRGAVGGRTLVSKPRSSMSPCSHGETKRGSSGVFIKPRHHCDDRKGGGKINHQFYFLHTGNILRKTHFKI